jgi:putative endonuclease
MTATPDRDVDAREGPWLVYIVECRDGSLYTGITNDLERRVQQHNEGSASRYTRSRRPVVLRYHEQVATRSQALIRECALKLMTVKQKRDLIGARPAGG